MPQVFLALGGNLGDPVATVQAGVAALTAHPALEVTACSSLYRTPPLGPPGQPDYINAALAADTELVPEALLDVCQGVENTYGRTRDGERWGPRTLDVDILLYADRTIDTARLVVPHPRMHERAFVLLPLAEIDAERVIPGHGSVAACLAAVDQDGIERLAKIPA